MQANLRLNCRKSDPLPSSPPHTAILLAIFCILLDFLLLIHSAKKSRDKEPRAVKSLGTNTNHSGPTSASVEPISTLLFLFSSPFSLPTTSQLRPEFHLLSCFTWEGLAEISPSGVKDCFVQSCHQVVYGSFLALDSSDC